MCLNETCCKVHISKYLSDAFPTQNGLEKGYALSPLLFNFTLEYAIRKFQETLEARGKKKTGSLASSVSRVCVGVRMPWFVCNTCVS
jgi:hypothetical protein